MSKMRRLGALALALVMTLTALAGCGGGDGSASSSSSAGASSADTSAGAEPMDLSQITDPYLTTSGLAADTVVATAGDMDITAAELLYWINYGTALYLSQFGGFLTEVPWDTDLGGTTMAEQMKQSSLEAAAFYALLPVVGREEGLSPADGLEETLDQQLAEMADQLGSEQLATYAMWYDLLTPELLLKLNQRADLHMQLQELYYGEGSEGYPTDAEVLAYAQDELGCFRVKHILLSTMDLTTREALDEGTAAEKKALADDLLAQLRAAEDPVALFDELMNEHSEDTGLAANPDGYVFTASDSLVGGFREAALELADGEISEVVETDYGYHILLRLPLDPADYRDEMVAQRMQVRSDQWIEDYGLTPTEEFDRIVRPENMV